VLATFVLSLALGHPVVSEEWWTRQIADGSRRPDGISNTRGRELLLGSGASAASLAQMPVCCDILRSKVPAPVVGLGANDTSPGGTVCHSAV